MEKLIIENRTNRPMFEVLIYIRAVVLDGRISNDDTQYCYHTEFKNGISVSSWKNRNSDRLVVTEREE